MSIIIFVCDKHDFNFFLASDLSSYMTGEVISVSSQQA